MGLVKSTVSVQLLGFAIEFICDEHYLIDIVTQLYPSTNDAVPTQIKIQLKSAPIHKKAAQQLANQMQFTVNNQQLIGKNAASSCTANRQTMSGQIQLCSEMLKSPYLMRHQLFNTVCYFLLSYQYVTPVHCSAFVIDGQTFVCVGKSGAGKSNLAMAALKHGFGLMSEDLAFVSGQQLLSDCREIHLPGDSLSRFDSLQSLPLGHSHNGKQKYIVPIPPHQRIAKSEKLSIVFIKPNYCKQYSTIDHNNNSDLFQPILTPDEAGFDLCCLQRPQHIQWLTQQNSYVASIGCNANDFFKLLGELAI